MTFWRDYFRETAKNVENFKLRANKYTKVSPRNYGGVLWRSKRMPGQLNLRRHGFDLFSPISCYIGGARQRALKDRNILLQLSYVKIGGSEVLYA